MIDPQKVDLNRMPKTFADGALGSYSKAVFYFSMTTGENLHTYATTPQCMKSISVWMQKLVENYENSFGEIDMTPPSIISPIQVTDLEK